MRRWWQHKKFLISCWSLAAALLLLGVALPGLAGEPLAPEPSGDDARSAVTTVILVRHVEKAAEPASDPPLTAAGEARAEQLGKMLARAGVSRIYSTDTRRTRDTAAIIAVQLGLPAPTPPATVLPPGDLEAMAAALAAQPGEVVLSVGHSNTLGPLAELLGAKPFEPIPESDYAGLYVLTLSASGVSTLELRQPPVEVHAVALGPD